MKQLMIPKNYSGISKTLRIPENIVDDVQVLANMKNLSFNKTVITLLEFSIANMNEEDKKALKKLKSKI